MARLLLSSVLLSTIVALNLPALAQSSPTQIESIPQPSPTPPPEPTAQTSSTRNIVMDKLGYSFDVPTWARVMKNGNSDGTFLHVLTQANFEARQANPHNCIGAWPTDTAGCADVNIAIVADGRNSLAELHELYTIPCQCDLIAGPQVYKGEVTVNGRTYRKYDTGDETGLFDVYLYLTKGDHLVVIALSKEPYKGSSDALTTILGSFKD